MCVCRCVGVYVYVSVIGCVGGVCMCTCTLCIAHHPKYSPTQRSGHGTLKTALNCVYEGSWDKDMKHGAGKELYANGDMYEGTFELNRVSSWPKECSKSSSP